MLFTIGLYFERPKRRWGMEAVMNTYNPKNSISSLQKPFLS